MRILFIILTAVCATTLNAAAQDTSLLMRPAYQLKVAVDKESFYSEDIHSGPYMLPENTIQLYPGETVYIEIDQEYGVIKKMRAVPVISDSAKTMTITFSQLVKERVHTLTMLQVTNPFDLQLIYKAHIFLFRQKKWVSTSVYPVEPRLVGYETWPDIIISVGLGGWALQKTPA
jgi:hypothetical protein